MLKAFSMRFLLAVVLLALIIMFLSVFHLGRNIVDNVFFALNDYTQAQALLSQQNPGIILFNPVKYAIRNGIQTGVSIETISLLLLLPLIASFIAAARHLIGLRGFGIFLPAALSAVFVQVGPIVGILLFLLIVLVSTTARMFLRKMKVKLQYLPRMALILWAVVLAVLGVLLLVPPLTAAQEFSQTSIFPVLILILLAEDFTRVQLGKSIRVAISLTSETLILALIAFGILEFRQLQNFALLNPEALLILVFAFNIFLGKYSGLRLVELWRFRRLIKV